MLTKGNLTFLLICLSASATWFDSTPYKVTGQRYKSPNVPNIFLETPQIVARYGYPVETHTVATEDGYLLTVHRIPGSPKAASGAVGTPVLLQHALLMASDVWVATGPDRGLGFLLADQGYDVWLGNFRGNLYSRKHKNLSPEGSAFWNFTVHEMGMFDLPAVIDHILKVTDRQQLLYVGHSLGCTAFFVLTTTRPEYNTKIGLMIAMAPGVYNGRSTSWLQASFKVLVSLPQLEVAPRTSITTVVTTPACKDGQPLQALCSFAFSQIYGRNPKELNTTLLPLYMSLSSSGTSRNCVEHMLQIFQTDRFQTYDRKAWQRGTIAHTPLYDLSLVTAPVVLMYAENDAILHPRGMLRLRDELPNVLKTIRVADDEATHGDFVFGNNVRSLVYDDVISLLRHYGGHHQVEQ